MKEIIGILAREFNILPKRIENIITLNDGGATIPFIARYRKEMTGSLDEVVIGEILERLEELRELSKRKERVLSVIDEKGELTEELHKKVLSIWNFTELDDIYLPYKPKRRTRAEIARERGLEPLAKIIMSQKCQHIDIRNFLSDEITNRDQAVSGAKDIIAEWINEDSRVREKVRNAFKRNAIIESNVIKSKKIEGDKYRNYFNYTEPLKKCTSHRILAILRGEEEGILRVSIKIDDEIIEKIEKMFLKGYGECSNIVSEAVIDSYKRLIRPSIENEFRSLSKERADKEAIDVFANNLKGLLMASPLGQKRILAIDPGFRTGCKVVCLDEQGTLLDHTTIYPHSSINEKAVAKIEIKDLISEYKIDAIAIGRGTAGRETKEFIESINLDSKVKVYMVNEDGASVYSASKVARDEFPNHDITVRGAVSIGRRLMDPLAELVKIDAKSIGVGQYQHDVDQALLKKRLDTIVKSCVNNVGVNLNTASPQLLSYVSGLGPQLAKNIVEYRNKNGLFTNRDSLKLVSRLGEKAFEQCAGFLRIPESKNPLDNTAVHPERYSLVESIAQDENCDINTLIRNDEIRKNIKIEKYISETIGIETLTDIISELEKPGRDPREPLQLFEFDNTIKDISDIKPGMILNGIVSNVTNFGCFVDLGIKTKGLVHISQLKKEFVKDPNTVVKVHQQVQVKVIEIDINRNRISLSMRDLDD